MFGLSYFGFSQLAAASTKPPHLTCVCPFQCDMSRPIYYNHGGTFGIYHLIWLYNTSRDKVANMDVSEEEKQRIYRELDYWQSRLFDQLRHFPLAEIPAANIEGFPYLKNFTKALLNIHNMDAWREAGCPYDFSKMDVPMFHLTGWYDGPMKGVLSNYAEAKAHAPSERMRKGQKLVIGPWLHGSFERVIGDMDFGDKASWKDFGIVKMMMRWYDFWLKDIDTGILEEPEVQVFVMGGNYWRQAETWPLPRTRFTDYLLQSGGRANSRSGDGILSPEPKECAESDSLLHDPEHPVWSSPWRDPEKEQEPIPPIADQGILQDRSDVLVYTTAALEKPLEITGPLSVRLYASTTGEDADFCCRLTDVYPDGRALNLASGEVRARYRNGMNPSFITPLEVYEYVIDLGATGIRIPAGHRIRLDIAGSNYPGSDINSGTTDPVGFAREAKKAVHTIYHSAKYPSALILPVIPEDAK
jgi:putative CocE/NonD family hydrolase